MSSDPHPVSRAELARRAGVSRSAITKACKKRLADAVLPSGMVDVAHPTVVEWARARGLHPDQLRDPGSVVVGPWPVEPSTDTEAEQDDEEILEADRATLRAARSTDPADDLLLDMTFREISDEHGSQDGFGFWLDARKKWAEIRKLELANADKAGRLIARDFVKTHVFGAIEGANRRLLSDSPKTIARRIYALARAEAPIEEAEKVVRELISSQLRPVAATAARVLREERTGGSS